MIEVVKYWGITRIPQGILEFCFDQDYSLWACAMEDLIFKDLLTNLFESNEQFSLNKALMSAKAEVVDFWLSKNTECCTENRESFAQACKFGRLDLVQTLWNRDFELDHHACYAAAQYGHVHVLEYFHSIGCLLDMQDMGVPRYAARGGQLNCLKYLQKIGCLWDENLTLEIPGSLYSHRTGALFNDVPPWIDDYSLITSTTDDYVECLRYALENGCPIHKDACEMVCLFGLFEQLSLLHQYGAPWDRATFKNAVYSGNIDCVYYLYENGCPWDHTATTTAAARGNVNILQYLLVNDCPWNEELVPAAVNYNNLSCLQYALQFGCTCDLPTSRLIALEGSVDWLRCLFDYACPYEDNILEVAARAETDDCLRYLIEEQGLYMAENGVVFEAAFRYGHLDSIQFLLDAGCPVPSKLCYSIVVDCDNLEDPVALERISFATQHKLNMDETFLNSVVEKSEQYPLASSYIRRNIYVCNVDTVNS